MLIQMTRTERYDFERTTGQKTKANINYASLTVVLFLRLPTQPFFDLCISMIQKPSLSSWRVTPPFWKRQKLSHSECTGEGEHIPP